MRLLAIVPSVYDRNPSQRYRIEQWEPLLRERGVEIAYRPFESEELNAVLYKPGRWGRPCSSACCGARAPRSFSTSTTRSSSATSARQTAT